jgi:hypothetical protein
VDITDTNNFIWEDGMKNIMLFRNGQWVQSNLKELPPHAHGKPEECDRCNAEMYWDLERIAIRSKSTQGKQNVQA